MSSSTIQYKKNFKQTEKLLKNWEEGTKQH